MSYKVLLKLLTKTFLLDDDLPEFKANSSLQTAIESHRASFTSLQKSLKEAKLEVVWNGDIRGCTREYDALVKSMQRLAQSVGGLRSSCGLQFELMQQDHTSNSGSSSPSASTVDSKKYKPRNGVKKKNRNKETWNIKADHHRQKLEGEMKRQRNQHASPSSDNHNHENDPYLKLPNHHSHNSASQENNEDHNDQDGSLIEFIHTIRQPLKSLAYTCKQTILHLQVRFSDKQPTGPKDEILKNNLVKAIALFEVSQRQAVKRLNRHRERYHHQSEHTNSYAPKEEVFLVYFFVFNMIEFARELICLVESVQALSEAKGRKRTICALISQFFKKKIDRNEPKSTRKSSQFVPNERHKMDTLHTPVPKTKWRQLVLRVWRTFSLFKLQKMRYATKATIAVIILAIPAFIESTGEWFRAWRMEWALITVSLTFFCRCL